jgi:hypothetical protein
MSRDTKFPPEDGAIIAETCGRKNNNTLFHCVCAFSWCIEDMIYEKMHGMDNFNV